MKKQLVKGFTMLMLIVALAFVTAVATANGQSRKATAHVPFEFIVGNQSLSAGEYRVESITESGQVLMIKSADTKQSALRMTNPAGTNDKSGQAKLVFHRYGVRSYLAEVWLGNGEVLQLAKSRQERATEREIAEIARIASKSELARYKRVEILATAQ